MVLGISKLSAIGINIAQSVRRQGLVRGLGYYTRSVLLRVQPSGSGKLVDLKIPDVGKFVKARRGTHDGAVFRQVFLCGEYDFPLQTDPAVIVDAGAHVGYASAFFAMRFPDAKIISLEPEPSNAALLRANTQQFPNVTALEAALWKAGSTVTIANPDAAVWSFRVAEANPEVIGQSLVEAVTVCEIIEKVGFIDLFKIDIEGAEIELFEGNSDWLDCVGTIVIELHDRDRKGCSDALFDALDGRGYSTEHLGENLVIRLTDSVGSDL